jgi:hypothetical protein
MLEMVLILLLFGKVKELIFMVEIHNQPADGSESLVFRFVYDLVQGPASSFAGIIGGESSSAAPPAKASRESLLLEVLLGLHREGARTFIGHS